MLPTFPTSDLPVVTVPLLIAVLCGVVYRYQPSPGLRLLGLATLCSALGMAAAALVPRSTGLIPDLAVAMHLLAGALAWRSTAQIFGHRLPRLWLVLPSLLWLALCMIPALQASTADRLLAATLISGGLSALCMLPLLKNARESDPQSALLLVGAVQLCCTALWTVSIVRPQLLPWPWLVHAALPVEMLVYIVLWPGLSLILIAERALVAEQHEALRDELTGILNRRGFWRAAAPLHRRTIVLLDIDHFKRINDNFGHAAGDAVIRRFTRIAAEVVGPDIVLGRIGGDEFALAIDDVTVAQARHIAEAVRLAAGACETVPSFTVSIGVSVGADGLSVDEQMAMADHALYRAKRLTRNRTELHIGGPPETADDIVPDEPEPIPQRVGLRAGRRRRRDFI